MLDSLQLLILPAYSKYELEHLHRFILEIRKVPYFTIVSSSSGVTVVAPLNERSLTANKILVNMKNYSRVFKYDIIFEIRFALNPRKSI